MPRAMDECQRYAVYFAPEPGPLSDFGAAWLGWDAAAATAVAHPDVPGLPRPIAEPTSTPRKYGFHGTLKPPFRLADGCTAGELRDAVAALAARLAPVQLDGLELAELGRFVALVPEGDTADLGSLAAAVVEQLDAFRAPPNAAELAKRRATGLSARQEANLIRWGYPYVMEEFRFHLTLTGPLQPGEGEQILAALRPVIAPVLTKPVQIREICLFGEAADGRFRILQRDVLSG